MKHRHHVHEKNKKASGGKVDFYAGGESNVAKEAEEKKKGGAVKEKKRGKHVGHVEGHMAKHRMDRPGRKRGGGVGADMRPLSSAGKVSSKQEGHRTEEEPSVNGG